MLIQENSSVKSVSLELTLHWRLGQYCLGTEELQGQLRSSSDHCCMDALKRVLRLKQGELHNRAMKTELLIGARLSTYLARKILVA